MRAPRKIATIASIASIGALLTIGLCSGCGDDSPSPGSQVDELSTQQVLGKLQPRISQAQVEKALGPPTSAVTSSTLSGAVFMEYAAKDGIVAVTVVDGFVTDYKVIDSANQGSTGATGATGPTATTVP